MSIVSRRDAANRKRGETCPLCGKPAVSQTRPFCSQGCRDRDLLNWLGDAYRVPARPDTSEDEDVLDSGQ